jgi:predicted transposase YdaD
MINEDVTPEDKLSDRAEETTPVHHPHDKIFFTALKNHAIARDAIRSHVPSELVCRLDLTKMTLYKTKLVSPQMKEFQADILYEIPFADTTALVLFHCEHESKPKRTIPLKVWQYLFLVLMEYAENHPSQPLPIPFPLVIYTGEAEFKYSTNLFDLFGEHRELAQEYFLQGVPLVDVCRLEDEDIKKHPLFGLSEFAFKHKKSKDFEAFLVSSRYLRVTPTRAL